MIIKRAEHRDTQAIQAKLDELLRAHGEATELTQIDREQPEEISIGRKWSAKTGTRLDRDPRLRVDKGSQKGYDHRESRPPLQVRQV